MARKYSRGDRFLAYAAEAGVDKPVYNTDSAKGMRDQIVRLMVEAKKYQTMSVLDTVTGTFRSFTGDSVLNDWRI